MKYKLLSASIICVVLLLSCTKDNNDSGSFTKKQKEMQEEVINLQSKSFNSLLDLLEDMDYEDAFDQVLEDINSDPSVDWAEINDQGIVIQYESGIRGGIYLKNIEEDDYDLDYDNDGEYSSVKKSEKIADNKGSRILPSKKRSLYISPDVNAFKTENDVEEDMKLLFVEGYLALTDYYEVDKMLNEDANLQLFTHLNDYGIIIITSTGFRTSSDQYDTEEVYMKTGEKVNETTSSVYWNDIENGDIPLIFASKSLVDEGNATQGDNYYWITSGFITKYNDLGKDTLFIFGGFEDSFVGGWPGIIGAGTNQYGGYIGYEGCPYYAANFDWLLDFLYNATHIDNSITCGEWINGNTIEKSRTVNDQIVTVNYEGLPQLAFVKKDVPPYNYCILKARVRGESSYYDGSTGFDPVFFGNIKVNGTFTDKNTFEANWTKGIYSIDLKITGEFDKKPVITDISFHNVINDYDIYTEHIESIGIKFYGYYPTYGGVVFDVKGESTCELFTNISYEVEGGDGIYTRELINYECDNNSYFNIVMGYEDIEE